MILRPFGIGAGPAAPSENVGSYGTQGVESVHVWLVELVEEVVLGIFLILLARNPSTEKLALVLTGAIAILWAINGFGKGTQ